MAKKSNNTIALEVICGKWGSGKTRKEKLIKAGYNYDAIQKIVNDRMKKKSIETVAKEVIGGKWGNGDVRKKCLTVAGYNYDAIQKKVNDILNPKETIVDKELKACKTQAEWMKNYTYKWENNPTIEKSKKYGTCVTYVACVLQRISILKSGECIWHDKKGKVDFSNNKIDIIYLKGTLKSLKSKLKKGDVVMAGDKDSTKAGGNSHIFILEGTWDSSGNPYVWDNQSATRVKQGKNGLHTYGGGHNVIAVVRLKESK